MNSLIQQRCIKLIKSDSKDKEKNYISNKNQFPQKY